MVPEPHGDELNTPPPEVCARWNLTPGPLLASRATRTWAVERQREHLVLKCFPFAAHPDWRYPLRVAQALRQQDWPTPEPVEDPLVQSDCAWVLLNRLPGDPRPPSAQEQRLRGRLLAELHLAAADTQFFEQREGFSGPQELVTDPDLDRWLQVHEQHAPDEGRLLRTSLAATAHWFDAHPALQAPRSVIHGDFAPWNLLFEGERLTGLLDFEATHYTFQVADFALSWRGYQDEVLLGYDEVRPLSDEEWHLVLPTFWAWLFLGLRDELAAFYRDGVGPAPQLGWQMGRLQRRSALLRARTGVGSLW